MMKKLRLNLEVLAVDSFVASSGDGGRGGTVHAHFGTRGNQLTCGLGCCNTCVDCPPAPTAEATCPC